jgi:hypothetical protein
VHVVAVVVGVVPVLMLAAEAVVCGVRAKQGTAGNLSQRHDSPVTGVHVVLVAMVVVPVLVLAAVAAVF